MFQIPSKHAMLAYMVQPSAKSLERVAKKFGIDLLYLFGSQARGDAYVNSDMDIAYRATTPLDMSQFSALSSELANTFNTTSDKIDLTNLAHVTPLLSFLVSQEGKLLVGTAADDDTFYRSSVMKHIDAAPLYQAQKKYIQSKYA